MSPRAQRTALIVFAKAPRPGLVKTRLCPPLSPEEAANFYSCMLDDVLESSVAHTAKLGLEPLLAGHPPDGLGELADRAPPPFRVVVQVGAGLGERMDHAIRQAAASGFDRILLRGSDNPMLGVEHLRAMLELLEQHDVVLTPDRDGGYGAVGVRGPVPGLFDQVMSSDHLLNDTVQAARDRGVRIALGPESFDIDSADDLATFNVWLEHNRNHPGCVRTAQWLSEHEYGGSAPV